MTDPLEVQLEKLSHLAGYAGALRDIAARIQLYALALEIQGGEALMSVASELKDLSASVATASGNVRTAIEAAIARLADNPTAADLAEVSTNLSAALGELTTAETAATGIDPEQPGGVVTDPDNPGEVVEG